MISAINKLSDEIKGSDNEYKKLVAAHLIRRVKEDSGLGDDICKDGKTLTDCLSYIRSQAKKFANDGVAVIEDSKVYEWAEDYYRSGTAKPESKPNTKAAAKSVPKKKAEKPTPIPSDAQVSLFDDDIIDETDTLWLF